MSEVVELDSKQNGFLARIKTTDWKFILFLTLFAMLSAFTLRYFIIETGIFSTGMGGFTQGLTYSIVALIERIQPGTIDNLVMATNLIYWIILSFINSAVLIFAYRFYGGKFFYSSLYVFFVSLSFSMILNFVPYLNETTIMHINEFRNEAKADGIIDGMEKATYVGLIFISSIFGGLLYGYAIGSILKLGSSSLGLDPIARYFSREKGINLTRFLFAFSFINALVWTFVIQLILGNITEPGDFLNNVLFRPELIASFIFIFIYSYVAGRVYATNDKVLVEVNTNKTDEISNYLNTNNYHRSHSIIKSIGGYTKAERGIIKIIVNKEEMRDIENIVKEIDPGSFVYIINIRKTLSDHLWSPRNSEDEKVLEWREKRRKKHELKKEKKKAKKLKEEEDKIEHTEINDAEL